MKKVVFSLLAIILCIQVCQAQNLVNVFGKKGKIFVQYEDGNIKEIVALANTSVVGFSTTKNFIVYQKLDKKSQTAGEEGGGSYDKFSIRMYDLKTEKATVLFTTCYDGIGGTRPSYAESNIYPIAICAVSKQPY